MNWRSREELVGIPSKGVTLIAEKWLTDRGETLEYWRVEKADSVIVLPLQGDTILICLPPTLPVGVQRATVDFRGRQGLPHQTPRAMVPQILTRELGMTSDALQAIIPISGQPGRVNGAFSNQ
ncbi:MAG: hypothetical protein KatS3mg067_0121 [Thermosynechococcus sp.]|nr:MAG: hypothetical protein KatS3mg067_0121 [Thermosynechococcus sp.]